MTNSTLEIAGLLSLSDRSPNILVPVFRTVKSANSYYLQEPGIDGTILRFLPIAIEQSMGPSPIDLKVSVGDEMLLAFRDITGDVHCDTRSNILPKVKKALKSLSKMSGDSLGRSLFRAELCLEFQNDVSEDFLSASIKNAFRNLKNISVESATGWRDGIVLPDVLRRNGLADFSINPFFIHSIPPVTHIYSEFPIEESILSDVGIIARSFGISRFIRKPLFPVANSRDSKALWILIGQGGVARHVLLKDPFYGQMASLAAVTGPFAVASIDPLPFENGAHQTCIAITKSDLKSVSGARDGLAALGGSSANPHIFNIRPIGFGTVSERMLSPFEVRNMFERRSNVWIVSRHRQRRMPSSHNGLRASNMAARIVKNASQALITSSRIQAILPNLREYSAGKLGVVSSLRILSSYELPDNLARLFRSCASSEVDVEQHGSFSVHWPGYERVDEVIEFKVLNEWHSARVVSSFGGRSTSVVGFLSQVREPSPVSFRRFCAMMFEDFRWRFREDDGVRILLENEGEGLFVMPVHHRSELESAVDRSRREGMQELLVTNFGLRDSDFDGGSENFELIHFSQIAAWMGREFDTRIYEDW